MSVTSYSRAFRAFIAALLITSLSACSNPDVPIENKLLGFRVGDTVDLDDLIERQSNRPIMNKSRPAPGSPPENYFYQAEGFLYKNYTLHTNDSGIPLYIRLQSDEGGIKTSTDVTLIPGTNIIYSIEGEISVYGNRFNGFSDTLLSRYEEKYGSGSSLTINFLGKPNHARTFFVWWDSYWEANELSLGLQKKGQKNEDVRLLLVNEAVAKRFERASEQAILEDKKSKEELRAKSITSAIDNISPSLSDDVNK